MNDEALVEANREQAFPQLRDPNDTGIFDTEIKVVVPFKVHRDRRRLLIKTLEEWVHAEGLDDVLDQNQVTYIIQDVPKP